MNDIIEFGNLDEDQMSSLIAQLELVAGQISQDLRFEHVCAWLMMCKPAIA